ncbi:hypothetical protein MKW92_047505 [Papaver armeniacum]|nr:hypothetical protein MKW92_047505 [Papaver armeniacum]
MFNEGSSSSLIRLPERRKAYIVNISTHIGKKSREQFEMRIKNQYQVIKRQRLSGSQFELQFDTMTRLLKWVSPYI